MSLAISAQQRIHIRHDTGRVTTSEAGLGGHSAASKGGGSLQKDVLLVLFMGAAFAAFYLLFKVVSIAAGLPFP